MLEGVVSVMESVCIKGRETGSVLGPVRGRPNERGKGKGEGETRTGKGD